MAQTMEFVRGVRVGGIQYSKTELVSEEELVSLDAVVLASTALERHFLALDISQVKAIYCGADQDGLLRLNSNVADPITLDPDKPLLWAYGDVADNPLGESDITSIYITNSSTTGALTLNFRALLSSPL